MVGKSLSGKRTAGGKDAPRLSRMRQCFDERVPTSARRREVQFVLPSRLKVRERFELVFRKRIASSQPRHCSTPLQFVLPDRVSSPMSIRRHVFSLILALSPVDEIVTNAATAKIDLDRTQPVPSDQPVPVMDFFRPLLLESPKLNETGTHIAALVNTGEDRHDLLISELDEQTISVINGGTNKDIYSFNWLDARRLLFEVSTDKLYGLGLIAADVARPREGRAILQYTGARLVSIPQQDRLRPLIWARSDAFNAGKDRGVLEVDTTLDTGGLINLWAAGADHSLMKTAEANNERHIVKSYPVAPGGQGWSYLSDKDGELAFAITSVDGLNTLHRLENGAWVTCPVDLEQIEIITSGDNPGELVVLGPR